MGTDIKSIVEGATRAVGTVVGTAAGVAAGAAQALVGKAPQKPVDPMAEEVYWREHFAGEPYFDGSQYSFDDYLAAGGTGWRDLEQDWNWNRGKARLLWQ